jgi:hypothetical protein
MTRRPWPVRLAIEEGRANARSGRAVALVIIVATAWLCAGVALANSLDVASLQRAERAWIDAGGYAFVVQAPSQSGGVGALDPVACERLNTIEGIDAAFAVRRTPSTVAPGNAKATDATMFEASPGVYTFLGLTPPPGPGVVVTAEAAATTGVSDGETTQWTMRSFDGSAPPVTFTATATLTANPMLAESLKGAYLLPSTFASGAEACYVRSDASHAAAVENFLPTALGSESAPAVANPRLSANTYGLDFATAYGDRMMRWSPFAGAAVLAAMWAIVQWTRRTRMAIYATFGAPPRARMLIQFSEWAVLSGIGAIYGWGLALVTSIGLHVAAATALVQVTGVVAVVWFGASIAAVVIGYVPVGTLLDALKDRS